MMSNYPEVLNFNQVISQSQPVHLELAATFPCSLWSPIVTCGDECRSICNMWHVTTESRSRTAGLLPLSWTCSWMLSDWLCARCCSLVGASSTARNTCIIMNITFTNDVAGNACCNGFIFIMVVSNEGTTHQQDRRLVDLALTIVGRVDELCLHWRRAWLLETVANNRRDIVSATLNFIHQSPCYWIDVTKLFMYDI